MRCVIKVERKRSKDVGYIKIDHDKKVYFVRRLDCATFFENEGEAKKAFRRIMRNAASKKQDIQEDVSGVSSKKRQEDVTISVVVLIEYRLLEDSYKVFMI